MSSLEKCGLKEPQSPHEFPEGLSSGENGNNLQALRLVGKNFNLVTSEGSETILPSQGGKLIRKLEVS